MSPKPQRWEWAIGLEITELDVKHLYSAYKLNWDNLCKFDTCRKNCKRILCLACFDRSWTENDSANNSSDDNFETTNCEQKRKDLKTFVGLRNLGATCYVNCLLQLWFHNPALRKAIYEWDPDSSIDSNEKETNSLVQYNRVQERESPADTEDQPEAASTSHKTPIKRSREEISGHNSSTKRRQKSPPCGDSYDKQELPSNQQSKSLISPSRNHNSPVTTPRKNLPIEQLQLIFARLQFTNKKSIDPFNFIDSLALNAAEQQDAQEFGNLFMEFLEKSFANQSNRFVSKIIQNQFCGQYSYATTCDHCKHSSLSDSKFYELDLSIQNLETLHDCLNEFFRPVPLDGKYNCSHCRKAQSAHRKIILKSLPPTLNLQLLRFVYDVQRNIRQKLNSYIVFPEILDMNQYLSNSDQKYKQNMNSILDPAMRCYYRDNPQSLSQNGLSSKSNRSNIFVLSAVLIHRGSSPHSGHYIAHIKDRISKDWYKFNDDSVERIGPQLQVSTDGENISIVEDKTTFIRSIDSSGGKITKLESKSLKSKTAYMLVYQAQDNEAFSYPSDHSEDWNLPEHLQRAVLEENSKGEELFESLQIAKEVDQQILDARINQIKTIYEKLVCRSPSDKFEFIDKNWLQNWLTNSSSSAKFLPIDNSHLLCMHGRLDFRKADQVKCIKSEGADLLYREFGGGPRLQDAMCRDCVLLEVKLIQLKERMKEEQKFITSQAKFKLDDYDFADAFIVGKNSYRDWQALVMAQFKKTHPELVSQKGEKRNNQASSDEDDNQKSDDKKKAPSNNNDNDEDSDSESDDEALEKFVFNSDILCEHNQLIHDTTAWRIVPKEVWAIFRRNFGNDPTRPLIELNANTLMCSDCKRQEVEQQEIGGIQKQKASEQKSELPGLFHNRKRASWFSMVPGDEYYALDRQFLTKWQKFLRNPCNQEEPTEINNGKNLICRHGKCLYSTSNSNPISPECPYILISTDELKSLKKFYPIDHEIKFSIDPELSDKVLERYLLEQKKNNASKKQATSPDISLVTSNIVIRRELDTSGDDQRKLLDAKSPNSLLAPQPITNKGEIQLLNHPPVKQQSQLMSLLAPQNRQPQTPQATELNSVPLDDEEPDLTEIDWSECVVSEPDFCSSCHEILKQDELKELLNYKSATIYIFKVENPTHGPSVSSNNNSGSANGCTSQALNTSQNCDIDANLTSDTKQFENVHSADEAPGNENEMTDYDRVSRRRRAKMYSEDEANDFVPPVATKLQSSAVQAGPGSMLRRTTRRNRNREQAYTIKPNQTLQQLKIEIFQRCQVLPMDQRLFLDGVLLEDSSKTMVELRIVPDCSLKLEVDKPMSDCIDLIEDEPTSRKSCAQPETGFKGSLLLSNSHF